MLIAAITDSPLFWPILSMCILGGGLGLILAIASKAFHVDVDPRVEQVDEVLPGVNCGACGYPGCAAYAEAVVLKGENITLCAAGAGGVVKAIANIMGAEATSTEPSFATIACNGDGVKMRFQYEGVRTCTAASLMGLAGAFQDCSAGCLGLGSCAEACPFDAIVMGSDNLPYIDETKCTGCKKCALACPRNLPRIDPESSVVYVRCRNCDKGAVANKVCNHACIGCKKCEKECPFDAIHVENFLAVIDYEKCKHCGKCVKVCPKECIVNHRQGRRERKKIREAAESK